MLEKLPVDTVQPKNHRPPRLSLKSSEPTGPFFPGDVPSFDKADTRGMDHLFPTPLGPSDQLAPKQEAFTTSLEEFRVLSSGLVTDSSDKRFSPSNSLLLLGIPFMRVSFHSRIFIF